MSVQNLVCAYCAGIVAEGRCAVCRAARDQMARDHQRFVARVIAACLAAVALLVVMLVAQRSFGFA